MEHDISTYYLLSDYGTLNVSTRIDFHADHELSGDKRDAALTALIYAIVEQHPGLLLAAGYQHTTDGHDVHSVVDEQRDKPIVRGDLLALRDAIQRVNDRRGNWDERIPQYIDAWLANIVTRDGQ